MSKSIKSNKNDNNYDFNTNKTRLQTLIELKQNKFENIENRIEFIKLLLSGNNLGPMIDFDMCDTEHVENRTNGFDIRDIMTKKYLDFNKLISEIGGRLLYIKSGTTGHTFKGIIYDTDGQTEILNYAVKVVAYPVRENYGDVNDIKRPENAELMMLRVLSKFVVNDHTPHIVLPIATFNTSIKPFIALGKKRIVEGESEETRYIDDKKYDQFIKRYKQKEYHDEVSILISEWANGGDLLDYIRKNYQTMKLKDWRTLFFQIISVLCVIQAKYPGFRHNDLKANNILVQKIDCRKKNNFFLYRLNLNRSINTESDVVNSPAESAYTEFTVPNIGIQIKLWDFDFACIPNIVENSKVSSEWTDKINVKPEQNRYYDLHYFFNTLTKKGFFPEFWEATKIHHSVKQFVHDIVPDIYSKPFISDNVSMNDQQTKIKTKGQNSKPQLVSDRGRILSDIEFTYPEKILLEHPFFHKMRKNPIIHDEVLDV